MEKEKLRKKKFAKQKKHREKVEGKIQFKKNQKKNLKERLQILNAGKELRYWKKHFHFHSWAKLGVKRADGKGFRIVGKICKKCGQRKMNRDWGALFRKIKSAILRKIGDL